MAITTYEGLLETWANGIETMEQNLENLYGPATITPVLPSVTTSDGMLETVAEQTELAAWNFAKMYNYMSTETNTTRIVDVPDTALYYGQFAKIGGQTVVESGELISAEVTSVISKDAAGNTLQTYPIPAEVQALDGYGWSAGTAFNYIDYERKVFVKCVDKVVLDGTQTLTANWRADSTGVGWYYQYNLTKHALPPNNFTLGNVVSDRLMSKTYGDLYNHKAGIALNPSTSFGVFVWQSDATLTDATAINAYLSANPTTVYYELATPIETDISAYLTDTDIKVVPGGTLTFDNSNELDVPSEVRYIS